jgi:hypothetical protein
MKNAVGSFFLICAAVFAQNSSDNAAAEALKNRLSTMNLFNPKSTRPKPVGIAGAPAPKICSIPLLNVIPPGRVDTLMIHKPPANSAHSRGDTVEVPAPACNEALFTNK